MTINLTGVAILAGLSILVALPVHAQPNRPGSAKSASVRRLAPAGGKHRNTEGNGAARPGADLDPER